MKRPHSQVSRRNFLLAATAATAATAGAIVAKNRADGHPATSKDDDAKKGYQLTAHVQNYYRTAKI
jgi:hypothetical protein